MEWSESPVFSPCSAVFIPSDDTQYFLENIQTVSAMLYVAIHTQGVPCYVRASCCTLRATGTSVPAVPAMLVPSSWREVAGLVRARQPTRICDERLTHLETTMVRARRVCLASDGVAPK